MVFTTVTGQCEHQLLRDGMWNVACKGNGPNAIRIINVNLRTAGNRRAEKIPGALYLRDR